MRVTLALLIALTLTGCQRASGGAASPTLPTEAPAEAQLRRIPLGVPPGETGALGEQIRNPYEGDAVAVADGKALFSSMNCVYCHGPGGSGLMGPALNARGWRYGGAPAQLYNSIHDGRPQGMPAWGSCLPPDQIWKLVAYLESLGGASSPATPGMVNLGGQTPSTTGPQVNGQSQSDTAEQARVAGNAQARATER